ncbi:hypothetical protein ACFL0W_03580 [Nanoarchaeota archaeon]
MLPTVDEDFLDDLETMRTELVSDISDLIDSIEDSEENVNYITNFIEYFSEDLEEKHYEDVKSYALGVHYLLAKQAERDEQSLPNISEDIVDDVKQRIKKIGYDNYTTIMQNMILREENHVVENYIEDHLPQHLHEYDGVCKSIAYGIFDILDRSQQENINPGPDMAGQSPL